MAPSSVSICGVPQLAPSCPSAGTVMSLSWHGGWTSCHPDHEAAVDKLGQCHRPVGGRLKCGGHGSEYSDGSEQGSPGVLACVLNLLKSLSG
ncbi:hypothetical protein ACOMHN_010823 [Nucella lapillus]